MGTYLAKPVLEKCLEDGDDLGDPLTPLSWGVVDMQGWRRSMEDAHVARTDVIPPKLDDNKFDEVDKVGKTYPDESDIIGPAFSTSGTAKIFAVFDGHGGAEVARFCQLYLVDVLTNQKEWKGESEPLDLGKALVKSFHELDKMIDDPARREEIMLLRHEKPKTGESRKIANSFSKLGQSKNDSDDHSFQIENKTHTQKQESSTNDFVSNTSSAEGTLQKSKLASEPNKLSDEATKLSSEESTLANSIDIEKEEVNEEENAGANERGGAIKLGGEAGTFYQNLTGVNLSGDDAVNLFRKILHVSGAKDKGVLTLNDGGTHNDSNNGSNHESTSLSEDSSNGKSVSSPSKFVNGRQICNLPDHSIHAGCTSICAAIVGKRLVVANAGDSRAILCRSGGLTEALSFDHKPMQNKEKKRIERAGGFVNTFGRVNGNLNLSRSIGDLKYKKVPGLSPAQQMITAEPDIIEVTLNDDDEFMILACDGIWDCLTNEEAVKYVLDRIDAKTPTEIGIEMLDEIISDDPRLSQGIGGDNMTVMIVDFLPHKRSYRMS
eukprot:CAMPEP_0184868012 /NCGR_PEP_ID=MMETSP0580-20130426/28741_1 /TAXON_ID=1118495 /ORGANISM="Dactyliosolen fragilissimus" /LENGTH=548 /DNA_ID=CAMNT_0027368615 /DNA_START=100 /DNA_END=1746 /DNA_ORIENTATION=+